MLCESHTITFATGIRLFFDPFRMKRIRCVSLSLSFNGFHCHSMVFEHFEPQCGFVMNYATSLILVTCFHAYVTCRHTFSDTTTVLVPMP